ncbi:hypothetical protein PRIPAC_94514 [Pristionchus pacificus]|uniref:DUF148 domain-containing protein n=1 Tax=Pristionchus pacificus TaxID=54126 RepID=A0A2A6BBE6_PRIPA|nr:hypothetical protein PRIPAC_94514 [Pristionchus pacificus]|eukprot:PDM63205.1 hypothetical protein PRIPAC_50420 [Pristionchus pacificus]
MVITSAADSNESVDREDKKDWRGHKGHHEFLTDLPEEARKAYFAIKMDDDLSRNEKREKIIDWAQENGVEEEITAHFAAKDADRLSNKKAMVEAIEDLPEAYEKSLLRASHPCGGRHDHRHKKWKGATRGFRRHGSRRSFAEEEDVEF